jgi:hypothetical protein
LNKKEFPEWTIDLPQVIDKLYYIRLNRTHLFTDENKTHKHLVTDYIGKCKFNYHTIVDIIIFCCDFHIKMMSGSSLYQLSCLIYVISVCLLTAVSNAYCVVFMFWFSLSCLPYVDIFTGLSILDWPFGIL